MAFKRKRSPSLSAGDCTLPTSNRQDKIGYLCRHYGMSNLILTNNTGRNESMPFLCAHSHGDLLHTPTGLLPGHLASVDRLRVGPRPIPAREVGICWPVNRIGARLRLGKR